ncbi:DUF3173 domain-containing protein, partial [Streptococcus pneumoniae]
TKKIAVKKFEEARKNDKNEVQLGCSPFDNKRLGIATKNIVENLISISFSDIEGEKNGYIKDKEISRCIQRFKRKNLFSN